VGKFERSLYMRKGQMIKASWDANRGPIEKKEDNKGGAAVTNMYLRWGGQIKTERKGENFPSWTGKNNPQ